MSKLSKQEEFWTKFHKMNTYQPLYKMIMKQIQQLKQYPEKIIKVGGEQKRYERGKWTNDGQMISGLAITLDDNQMVCQFIDIDPNKANRKYLYSNITYTYMKRVKNEEHAYSDILKTSYQQMDKNGNFYQVVEQSFFRDRQNECERVIVKADEYNIISIHDNMAIRLQNNDMKTEYFIYELSAQEMKERRKGHQMLPYPLEPIDEKTYKDIQNGDYIKQKVL